MATLLLDGKFSVGRLLAQLVCPPDGPPPLEGGGVLVEKFPRAERLQPPPGIGAGSMQLTIPFPFESISQDCARAVLTRLVVPSGYRRLVEEKNPQFQLLTQQKRPPFAPLSFSATDEPFARACP